MTGQKKTTRKPSARAGLGKDPLAWVVPPAAVEIAAQLPEDLPETAAKPFLADDTPHPADNLQPSRTNAMTNDNEDLLQWDKIPAMDALNVLFNPITIADADAIIRFANEAAYKMFEAMETSIRRDLPNFVARDIVGQCIDVFHKNPAHQRQMMNGMKSLHEGKFVLGGNSLSFRATPILQKNGQLVSVFVEWQDQTSAVAEQHQIANLITEIQKMSEAHANGMISHFIPVDGMDDRARIVAEGTNQMVLGHIETKKKVLACVSEFAKGNFDAQIEKFSGERYFINDGIEAIRESFKKVTSEILRFCDELAIGNLDQQIDLDGFTGDYRTIVDTMERALVSLNETISAASQQIQQIAITVEQMSQSSQSLATNSQIQSSSVDEVSASTEQTNAQVKANAASADTASKLVSGAAVAADDGTRKIAEMVQAMEGIRGSSLDIAKIIKVIDEIAFQTNLLALNAAVEAARAGQHGRGFAVVAQEVRNLAGRSAKAARETSDLIDDASTRVKSGVRIADETRQAFTKIAGDIGQVKELVNDIAIASEEQARGVTQVTAAIGEVARSALTTSQQADELAASATQMSSATEMMRRDFNRYKLRKVTAPKPSATSLEDLSPEMLAQLRSMMMAQFGSNHPAGNDRSKMNGTHAAASNANVDRDERGFADF